MPILSQDLSYSLQGKQLGVKMPRVKEKLRLILEILFSALLLGTQTILFAGTFTTIMIIPLLPYLYILGNAHFSYELLKTELWALLSSADFVISRIVFFIGLAVLLFAAGQWFWYRHKHVELFTSGLYSKVRHPQFIGIIIITMGLTIMVLTYGMLNYAGFPEHVNISSLELVGLWFLQVMGYIGIAKYEDWHLSKKFKDEYLQYKRNVPFLFPIKSPKRIPETLFTILLVVILCIAIYLLPYNLIRVYSHTHFPNLYNI
jgi:protein-S-isoprenylcysteine O-methyltransferase Ste14